MTSQSNKKKMLALAGLMLGILLAMLALTRQAGLVFAQSEEEAWATPVNVSNSGAANTPKMFIDRNNTVHVLWSDAFTGLMYASGVGGAWSAPRELAFALEPVVSTMTLVPDVSGNVHAFWVSDDGNLTMFYSRVPESNFADPLFWTPQLNLAGNNIGDFDAAVDENGRVHLVYMRVQDGAAGPAGVYYTYADGPFYTFVTPKILFESLYVRGTPAIAARVSVDTGGGTVYAGWDLRSLEHVYITQSNDRGETWAPAALQDSRQEVDSLDAVGPSNVTLLAYGATAFRLWQAGHEGVSCTQYYQVTADAGITWSDWQILSAELQGCPSANQKLVGRNNEMLLMSSRTIGIFLQAWNGSQWSTPQLQTPLTGFTNPETFRQVEFGCRQAAFDLNNNLIVVGCDASSGEDVWATSRSLGSLVQWFPTPTPTVPWSDPNAIAANKAKIVSPEMVSDQAGRLHAFWNQQGNDAIYYARWEGEDVSASQAWSNTVAVVSAPGAKAEHPDALVDRFGRVQLVWSGGAAGGIGYSTVDSSLSLFTNEWSEPVLLPAPRGGGTSPQIYADANGTIYVTYAIPVNEARGVYLTRSDDDGITWSEPLQVFDAEAAGWDMVERPSLAIASDGRLHAIWTRYKIDTQTGTEPAELYYAQSGDGGLTWSAAEVVTSRPTYAGEIINMGGTTIQRAWSDLSTDRLTLWYQVSLDNGATWSEVARVSEFGNETEHFSLAVDQSGIGHIVQIRSGIINETGISPTVLQHMIWDGVRWTVIENFELGETLVVGMTSTIGASGSLAVLYTREFETQGSPEYLDTLLFIFRKLDITITIATPEPTFTPLPELPNELTPTVAPTNTPIIFPTAVESEGPFSDLGTYGGLILGAIPAIIIIIIAVSLGNRRKR